MDYRTEHDSMGEVQVPVEKYWGAQTQRSFENFKIGTEKMPTEIIRAFAILNKAAAIANNRLGKLDERRKTLKRNGFLGTGAYATITHGTFSREKCFRS